MANPYLIGAQVGLQGLTAFQQFQADQADADRSLLALGMQEEASDIRHAQQLRSIRKQSKRFQSAQKEKFISSGVKLEGSAVTALGDALANELEATLAVQQQKEETDISLALEQADIRSKRENAAANRFLQFLGSAAGSAAQGIK